MDFKLYTQGQCFYRSLYPVLNDASHIFTLLCLSTFISNHCSPYLFFIHFSFANLFTNVFISMYVFVPVYVFVSVGEYKLAVLLVLRPVVSSGPADKHPP